MRNKCRKFFLQDHCDSCESERRIIDTGLDSKNEAPPAEAQQVAGSISPGLIFGAALLSSQILRRFRPVPTVLSRYLLQKTDALPALGAREESIEDQSLVRT
jgi:hypothetical protein